MTGRRNRNCEVVRVLSYPAFKVSAALVAATLLVSMALPAQAEKIILPGIIGADEREAKESDAWPWIAIGRVNKSGSGHCTGTLVAPDLVVTASHCLLNKRTGRMHRPESMKFVAGYDRGDYRAVRDVVEFAFPDCGAYPAPIRRVDKLAFDVAVLRLAEPIEDIKPLDIGSAPDRAASDPLFLAGYQQDRPFMLSVHSQCSLKHTASSDYLLAHECDATRGASGGPLMAEQSGAWTIVGVHVASIGSAKNKPSALGLASTAVADGIIAGTSSPTPGECTPVHFTN